MRIMQTTAPTAARKWTEVFQMNLYTIKNKFSGTLLRDNHGDIRIFQSDISARNYIAEHLSDKYWDIDILRR